MSLHTTPYVTTDNGNHKAFTVFDLENGNTFRISENKEGLCIVEFWGILAKKPEVMTQTKTMFGEAYESPTFGDSTKAYQWVRDNYKALRGTSVPPAPPKVSVLWKSEEEVGHFLDYEVRVMWDGSFHIRKGDEIVERDTGWYDLHPKDRTFENGKKRAEEALKKLLTNKQG
jgi:hypothetical protein